MDTLAKRIKHVRKLNKMSQEKFAERLGLSIAKTLTRGAVGNWELGGPVSSDWQLAICSEFKVSLDWLVRGEGAPPVVNDGKGLGTPEVANVETAPVIFHPNAGLSNELAQGPRRWIDILGRAAGGKEGKFVLNGERIDRMLAPPSLDAVSKPYAVYAHGTSMHPRYDDGEMVLVNPEAPYGKGDYVVAQLRTDDEVVRECYLKRFISFNNRELVLEQLNPPRGHDAIMRFPASRVIAIHKAVGPDGR